jgi:NAD(P)-dependent dehydrogenase (short-subunit alcohol dehydrogenase family)
MTKKEAVSMDNFEHARYPSLVGKRVLITGGGSGIGAAFTQAFVQQGARVQFLDIDDAASNEFAASLGNAAQYTRCDLTDLDALARTLSDAPRVLGGDVQILVNNAANDLRHDIESVTPAFWQRTMDVNLRHLFFCAQAVVPGMKAAGGGVIVNLGSISWHLASPRLALYMSAKAAIEGLTRGLARDLGPSGIRVNTIVPGAIRTPKQMRLWHTPEVEAQILAGQCLKQRVDPEDVAALALFLASDSARRCTAREYFIDAGWYPPQ